MKRILFSICLLFMPLFVFAQEVECNDYVEEIKYYKTMYVSDLSDNSLLYIDENNLTSYTVEVTKEEYDNYNPSNFITPQDVQKGFVETNYKKMTTSITKNGSFYRYKVVLDWKTVPKVRSYDIIGIGFHASVTATDIMHFSQTSCKSTNNCSTTTAYTQYKGANGVGASFNVTDGDIISLSQTLYVDVKKTNSSATIIKQYAYGDYAHAVKTISKNNAKNYNVGIDGIILSSGISDYYDSINTANATWTGTW